MTRLSTMTSSTSEVVPNSHENTSSVSSRYARRAYGVNGNVLNLDEFQTENKAYTNPREMLSNSEKYENVISQESANDELSPPYAGTFKI